ACFLRGGVDLVHRAARVREDDALLRPVLPDLVAVAHGVVRGRQDVHVDVDQRSRHRLLLSARAAIQCRPSHTRPRNSTARCAARYDVIPVRTSSRGFTSTTSTPTMRVRSASADRMSINSAYCMPLGSAETHPGTNGRSRTSTSRLT